MKRRFHEGATCAPLKTDDKVLMIEQRYHFPPTLAAVHVVRVETDDRQLPTAWPPERDPSPWPEPTSPGGWPPAAPDPGNWPGGDRDDRDDLDKGAELPGVERRRPR